MRFDATAQRGNFALWFSVFAVWIFTAATYYNSAKNTDGIGGGDSAELALTALDHGTPHPPGYPILHMILSTGVDFLKSSGNTHRIELFFVLYSVITSASAIALYSLFLIRITDSILVGCTSFLFFALSDLVWTYAIHIEVFSLNHLFISIILNLMYTVQFQTQSNPNFVNPLILLIGAFATGLSLRNQQTIVIYVGVWILWVLFRARRQFYQNGKPKALLLFCAVSFLFGLSFYFYLPFIHPVELREEQADSLTSITNTMKDIFGIETPVRDFPAYSWGNTATWNGFFHHILRRDYGTGRLYPQKLDRSWTDTLQDNLGYFISQKEFNQSVIMLFFVGIVRQANTLRTGEFFDIGNVLLFSLFVYVFGFFSLCNIPLEQDILRGVFARFFQQANMLVYVFVALGISVFERIILWIVFVVTHQRIDRIIVQISLFVVKNQPLITRTSTVRCGSAQILNLIADAMWKNFIVHGRSADLAIINGGIVRGDSVYPQNTKITRGILMDECPFPLKLVMVEIKGKFIKEALEQHIAKFPAPLGSYPHVSGNVNVVFNGSDEVMNRIKKILINGSPMENEKNYFLTITQFLSIGGDNCSAYTNGTVHGEPTMLFDIILNYFKSLGELDATLEERVKQQ